MMLFSLANVTHAQTTLLQEGFENVSFPPSGWHVKNRGSNTTGETWMRATGTNNFHSGAAGAFSQDGEVGERMEEWLVTLPIAVSPASNLSLSFWHRLQWNTYSDGPEYVLISRTDTLPASFVDTVFTLPGTDPSTWSQVTLSLPNYSGRTIYIAFVHTSPNGYADAWVLDDVLLTSTPQVTVDVGTVDIVEPPAVAWVGQSYVPRVVIDNFGTTSQTDFPVTFSVRTVDGSFILRDTVSYVDTLAAGATDTVLFHDWSPAMAGQYRMIGQTFLVGDTQPGNDTVSLPLEITRRFHTGGPDAFGYSWIDSDTLGGPIYDWLEISQTGTPIRFYYSGDSTNQAQSNPPIPIGFSFPYYGIPRDTLSVDINGEIILHWRNTWYPQGNSFNWNLPSYPTQTIPANVAVFWDNLERISPDARGYCQVFGTAPNRYIVIEWHNFSSNYARTNPDYLTFEAILHENGDILLQYKDVVVSHTAVDFGVGATVGMQNDDYTIGLQYEFDGSPRGDLLYDSLAIRFYLPAIDTIPPTIVHTPRTNSFRLGETITAQIGDAQGTNADSIYYNVGAGWVAASHDSVNPMTSSYYYHIPPQVRGTVVSYYLMANDGSPSHNRRTVPDGAPSVSYSYKILPTAGVNILYVYSSRQDWRPYKDNPAYVAALSQTGFTYDTFDRDNGDGQFTFYEYVFINSPGPGTFDDENEAAGWIMTFLDTGTPDSKKKLFMTSQGYAWMQYGYANDVPIKRLFNQYLHSEWVGGGRDGLDNDPGTFTTGRILGEMDDFITDGQVITVFANSPNVINSTYPLITVDTSKTFVRFIAPAYAAGWSCGQKYEGERFNTVFFSFDLWCIDSTRRVDLLRRARAWLENPINPTLGVAAENKNIPRRFALLQSYPNPFNSMTTIEYDLPEASSVRLKVYNLLGQVIGTLVEKEQPAGRYRYVFDASHLPSGVYFYELQAGMYSATRKFVLLR